MVDYSQQIHAAERMLDLFASVGANSFDLSFKKLDEAARVNSRHGQTVGMFRSSIPRLVPSSYANQYSLIARPRSDKTALIQLDDLDTDKARGFKEVAFAIIETSPKNFQAWLAVADISEVEREDFTRRLKVGTGADKGASGAVRWAGTPNFKEKYAPNFPVVRVVSSRYGLTVKKTTLEALGMLAAPTPTPKPEKRATARPRARGWPSYDECLARAPEGMRQGRGTGKPSVSSADWVFSIIAADWGRSVDEIAARLMQLSSKAKDPQHGEKYAHLTATRAAATVSARGRERAPG